MKRISMFAATATAIVSVGGEWPALVTSSLWLVATYAALGVLLMSSPALSGRASGAAANRASAATGGPGALSVQS